MIESLGNILIIRPLLRGDVTVQDCDILRGDARDSKNNKKPCSQPPGWKSSLRPVPFTRKHKDSSWPEYRERSVSPAGHAYLSRRALAH